MHYTTMALDHVLNLLLRSRGKSGLPEWRKVVENTVIVYEWDSDAFHRRVLELQSAGYTSRQESYHILADVNPETGEIVHLHTIEMLRDEPRENEAIQPVQTSSSARE
jgi:hypothetical protein